MIGEIVAALSLGVLILTAPGCAETPVSVAHVQPASLAQIQKGVTTRDQVIGMFGGPIECRVTHDGNMTLSYHYSDVKPDDSILVVYINRDQIVSDYLLTKKSAATLGMAGDN